MCVCVVVCETFEDERDTIIVWREETRPVGKREVARAVKRSQHETELDEIAAQVKRVKDDAAAALLDIEVVVV